MEAEQQAPGEPQGTHRAAAFGVLLLMIVGCGAIWVGVPLGGMWLAGELTDSATVHPLMAISLILPGIFMVALALAWLNDLYVRLTGPEAEVRGGVVIRRKGPLEAILAACFFAAVGFFALWFLVWAENPSRIFGY